MRRAIVSELGALFGGPDALGVAVEGLGRPQRGALLLVAAVLVEAASGGDQLADGRDGAVVLQVRERPRQDLPRLVAMLTEDGEVLGRSLPDGVERVTLAPAFGRDHPGAGGTHRDEGQLLTAPGLVENRERLTPEDVRVSRQLDQRDGALEIGGNGALRPVESSRIRESQETQQPTCSSTPRFELRGRSPTDTGPSCPTPRMLSKAQVAGPPWCSAASQSGFGSVASQNQPVPLWHLSPLPLSITEMPRQVVRRARQPLPRFPVPTRRARPRTAVVRDSTRTRVCRAVKSYQRCTAFNSDEQLSRISSARVQSPAANAALAFVSARASL